MHFDSSVLFCDETTFSGEGMFNKHNVHMWALNNPLSTQLYAAQQHVTVDVWLSIVGTVYSTHTSYRLVWTLTSIASFYRRYFPNCLPMSPHLFGAAFDFDRTELNLLIEGVHVTIWTALFQTFGLVMVVPSLTSHIP
ncbi:hypothetical protein TNCV_1580851 [Trichonephila clavipes]|nr:hypothetical protein TNCV_1580851 [Trichonephila clavipes]